MATQRRIFGIKFSEEEKQELERRSKESGCVSIAEYIRHKCFEEKDCSLDRLLGFARSDELLDGKAERTYQVTTLLTKEEYNIVKKYAGNQTMAAYVRRCLLESQLGKFCFEIADNDVNDAGKQLEELNWRLNGFIAALSMQQQLYKQNIINLEKMLSEVNESIKDIRKRVITDRKFIRKHAINRLEENAMSYFKSMLGGV